MRRIKPIGMEERGGYENEMTKKGRERAQKGERERELVLELSNV